MIPPDRDAPGRLVADFLNPARRALATHELAALGADAVPVVASVLDGSARNAFGVPYRAFGEALRCAVVTARHLGPLALSLEPALVSELANADPCIRAEAAAALGALTALSESGIVALATRLDDAPDPAMEAAIAILRLNLAQRQCVLDALGRSARAALTFARATQWWSDHGAS